MHHTGDGKNGSPEDARAVEAGEAQALEGEVATLPSGDAALAVSVAHAIKVPLASLIANLDLAAETLGHASTDPSVRVNVKRLVREAQIDGERIRAVVRDTQVTEVRAGSMSLHEHATGLAGATLHFSRRTRQLRLLVVDDEVSLGKAAIRIFSDCEVVPLTHATEALARIVAGERFDVILCDLMMPKMTGMDLYDELVRIAPEQAQRMVFMTGGSIEMRHKDFAATVPNHVIQKPFEIQLVRELIRGLADRLGLSNGIVLVVDDDPSALKLMVHWLTAAKFLCVAQSSGEVAVDTAVAAPDRVEAIVLDAAMPGMSGFDVVARLRANPATAAIPVLLITARDLDESDIVEGVSAGAVDYLTKPSSGWPLVVKVRVACERSRAERDLRSRLRFAEERATTDALTGLMNRRSFDIRLAEAAATMGRHREPFALIMMDIDHFKRINDEFGHLGGDKALLYFARTMRRTIRTGDQAFRYGGEEFALLLPKSRTNDAFLVSTRIQHALREHPVSLVEGHTAIVQFSAGVASADASNNFRADDLIARADAALYRAKNNGRNRVELAE